MKYAMPVGQIMPLGFDPFAAPEGNVGEAMPDGFNPFLAPLAGPYGHGLIGDVRPNPRTGTTGGADILDTVGAEAAEVPAGVAAGATGAVGTAMRGVAATYGPSDEYRALLDRVADAGALDAGARRDLVAATFSPSLAPSQRTMLRSALTALDRGDAERHASLVERMRGLLPPPITERSLWQAGADVTEWGERTFPGDPDSVGRQIGQGLGSLGVGVAASAVNPMMGTALFATMGMGEAADRAAHALSERHGADAVASGAYDDRIARAAALGVGPGMTDVIPAEILLRRLPIPGARAVGQAVRAYGGERTMRALGRIGAQAAVEATQEGGQQALQNVIAQEIHSPETRIGEGILPASGIGGAVGGIAGIGREGVVALANRRSRSARGLRARAVEATPPPSEADEASPIPTEDIVEGRERVADAHAAQIADRWLSETGMPKTGQPVRISRAGNVEMEGVVSDAWSDGGGGIAIRTPDGTEADIPMDVMARTGLTVEVLPMPASRAEMEDAAAALTEAEDRELPAADVETTAGTEAETGDWTPPQGIPTLSPEQAGRVTELVRAGVAPQDAVAQAADVDTIGDVYGAPTRSLAPDGPPADVAPRAVEPPIRRSDGGPLPSGDVDTLGSVAEDTGAWLPPETVPPVTAAVESAGEGRGRAAPPQLPSIEVEEIQPLTTESAWATPQPDAEREGSAAVVPSDAGTARPTPPNQMPAVEIEETAPVEIAETPALSAAVAEPGPQEPTAPPPTRPDLGPLADETVETIEPVLRPSGEPYKTEKSAALAARARNLDATPVEVDGGWGLLVQAEDAGVPFGGEGLLGGEPTAAEERPVPPFPVPEAGPPDTRYGPEAFEAGVDFGGDTAPGEPAPEDRRPQPDLVMRADGQPFKTEKTARLKADRGLMLDPDEYAIVEVDGGFAIERGLGEPGPMGGFPTAREERPVPAAAPRQPRRRAPVDAIHGAERIGDRELAERRMEGRQGTDAPQQPADEGLFDVAGRDQDDIPFQRPTGPASAPEPPTRVRIRPSRRFDEERARVQSDLQRIGRQAFGDRFNVELAESITTPDGAQAAAAYDPASRIAWIALRADEPGMAGSVWHEGIHFLRRAGAFSDADGADNAAWRTLEAQAGQWRTDYDIDARYAADTEGTDAGRNESLLNEEAIAEALADYATRGKETGFGPTVRAALDRILRFFRQTANALRGRGFRTWEDVFEGIQRGDAAPGAVIGMSRDAADRYLQAAWHGSPHRFDRFSTEAIGTGEGNQTFGWGLYFTEKEQIAQHYRDMLTWYRNDLEADGALYRVDLAPKDDEWLLWDKPLSAHPQWMQDRMKSEFFLEEEDLPRLTGDDWYQMLTNSNEDLIEYSDPDALRGVSDPQQLTSLELLERAGIRGIKYLDDTSRDAGEGTYNYVVFDDADVSIEEILLQRGEATPKANREAFDRAASEQMGVDAKGAADAVIRDKDRMGGLGEEIRAQIKGVKAVQAANVKVEERPVQADLNVMWRFLAPADAWSRKFPAIHALIKRGIKSEINTSKWVQTLNKDWDGITGKLSKEQFGELSAVLFEGDAAERTFTDAELEAEGVSEPVRKAYRESRTFLDKIGRFVEQHNRKMILKVIQRRTKLVRQMAGERGMDAADFRKLYDARAVLLAEQRNAEGDPEELSARIDAATEAMAGTAEPTEKFQRAMEEADRLEPRIADTRIRRREGYVPHKFFGRWRVYRQTGVDEDGESTWEHIAGEHGFWRSRTEAVRAASHMARKAPDANYKVEQVSFRFPEEQATQLSDAAYFRFMGQVQSMTGLQGDELREAIQGTARRRFRRRIAGFSQYRHGVAGYSRDLDRVLRTHIGETVRYVALDELKYDAITTMEKEGLSENRTTVQARPVLAAAVNQWFKDVNGQKQVLEGAIDALLDKPYMSPLKGGAAAGTVAFLASGAGTNPISPLIGAYVGWRVGRGMAQGGPFKTRSITGAMLGDMSHLKLGMFFNVMSAAVNTTQVMLNTMPVLGTRYTGVGVKRFNKAVLSKLRGKPNADWRLMARNDIHPLNTFAEGTRHQFQREGRLSKVSMIFFTGAESFNRGVSFLGAVSKAEADGKSIGEAQRYGAEVVQRTQFHYGTANKPELFRNMILRVPAQFKNFVAQQIAFALNLKRREVPLFLLNLAMLTGALGIPGIDLIDELADWLFDFSPVSAMKEAALDAAAEGELAGGVATFLTRGAPGLSGVDLSSRVGMGDKFLPLSIRDWKGAWISTIENAARHGAEYTSVADQLRNLSPGIGNPLKSLETWQNGGIVANPWKRGRPEYEMTPGEMAMKTLGARPIREARLQDLRDVERRTIERSRTDSRRYVDRIVAALHAGDRAEAERLWAEAHRSGVVISGTAVRNAMRAMSLDRATRTLQQLPRHLREEGRQRREAIGAAGR